MTLKQVSINPNINLLFEFKKKCAEVLFQLTVRYEDKYLEMKVEIIETLTEIFQKFQFEYSTIHSIL